MTRPACTRARLVSRLIALCGLLALPMLLHAQSREMNQQQVRRMDDQSMQDREYALYHAGETKAEQQAAFRSIMPQLREDFRQLQLVNNGMMQQMVSTPALDYKLLNRAISEINKRAGRLKDNLALLQVKQPETKETNGPPVPADERQVKASLFKLDSLIMSFVNNPQFKQAGVVAVPQADRAGRDLHDIIELSRAVKKGLERLGKDASSTP
jgi:hypothetical protein